MWLANLNKEEQKLIAKLQQRIPMQAGFNGKRIVLAAVIISVATHVGASSDAETAKQALEKTRVELRMQGFKTDLTNFNFATSAESQAREAILGATAPNRNSTRAINNPLEHPNLMESTEDGKAVVVWKQDSLRRQNPSRPDGSHELRWEDFADVINEKESQVDAACVALQTGEIQFDLDASSGNFMLLRHLPHLKILTRTLNDRAMLALHEGRLAEAWTNLLAATRLVTGWNPEPVEISHRVRFENAKLVFDATWQVLQTNGWTDEQLALLQREWALADFLSRLPEVQAFRCASDVHLLEQDESQPPLPETAKHEEAQRLLLFYRDREMEYRNAVRAGSWLQMRQQPGVTNEVVFEPKLRNTRFQMILQQRNLVTGIKWGGVAFVAQAAEAEAARRVIVTALALERYREEKKRYPETLQSLTPEFLKSVPSDFLTGEPLHYRGLNNGRFLLYSLGLDCVDNGGKIPTPPTDETGHARLAKANTTIAERGWMLLAVWLGGDSLVLGIAHARGFHQIFGKRADGSLPLWSWLGFLPLLLYTSTVWHVLRLISREPAQNEVTKDLVVGRRLAVPKVSLRLAGTRHGADQGICGVAKAPSGVWQTGPSSGSFCPTWQISGAMRRPATIAHWP